jgi:HD-like signal output (HDOD) protein/tRNA A-37 threonylcarbamoyl transferase component Bud32
MANPGETFRNRFAMKHVLGKGATGEVHLAYDNYLQREVALKISLLKSFEQDDDSARNRRMWLNETRLAGKLKHPFIVQLIEAGSTDDFDYLVMEYVSGGTLKQHTTFDKLLPLDRVVDILFKVCNALDYAHKMGVLHRDIKPSNILLGADNTVKISDFGAAFMTNSELTQVDTVGTLPFMAPEHFRQSRPTMQSDVYAVGVMAYQLLSGILPFTAKSSEELIYQKLQGEALPLENRRQDIPQLLRFAVHRAMHPDKDLRYNSWKDLCEDLASAFPQKARLDEVRFDSSRFKILRMLPFFSGFSDTEVWEVVGICRWQEKHKGEHIVKEGTASSSIFFILSGQVIVTKQGVEINRLSNGDCFGEIAYLDTVRHLRLATVTTLSGAKLIELEESSLLHASNGFQASFAKAFLNLMVSRLGAAYQRVSLLENTIKKMTSDSKTETKNPQKPVKILQSPINLREALKNLHTLPVMPIIAQKLLALNTDSDAGERQLLKLVEQDPQILARTIALANTPMLGVSSKKISSVKEAAMLLGIQKIKSVATCIAISSLKTQVPSGKFNLQDLWLHNLGVSFTMFTIARAMPRNMRPEDEQIILTGMLHDIGYLALAFIDPQRSDELHEAFKASPETVAHEIENSLLGICHDEIGAELARYWKLPEELIEILRYHHNPSAAPQLLLARMIYIAEKIQPSLGMAECVNPGVEEADWQALGISADESIEVIAKAYEDAELALQFAVDVA